MSWDFGQLRRILQQDTLDRELDDEISTHLELATAALVARGVALEEARQSALEDFGAVSRIKQQARDARGAPVFVAVRMVCGRAARLFRS